VAYEAEILLDSIAPGTYIRLTTAVVTFPRFILAEWNTHRVFSRNTASSRAIPVKKMIEKVLTDPVFPLDWGKNKAGMSADECLDARAALSAEFCWKRAIENAVVEADYLTDLGVHKQVVNRLLEPFSWTTTIITSTEWENFFSLRCNKNAQPEMQHIAEMLRDVYRHSTPTLSEYHFPMLQEDEWSDGTLSLAKQAALSTARCARVSYLTHEGKRDHEKDLELHDRLIKDQHNSPLEHVARSMTDMELWNGPTRGNFYGWHQYRHRKDLFPDHEVE
jgi:thymidylate synthase ThyX